MSDTPAKRESTEAQIAANQANAQLSTGPRTEEGKKQSSMNALKHGMRAKTVLLPDEDPEEYAAFFEAQWEELGPQDAVQCVLVGNAIGYMWRLTRPARIEAGLLMHHLHALDAEAAAAEARSLEETVYDLADRQLREPVSVADQERRAAALATAAAATAASKQGVAKIGMAFLRDVQSHDSLSRLARYEGATLRLLMTTLHELQRRQAASAGAIVPPPLAVDVNIERS
jgi:hypothetical protein